MVFLKPPGYELYNAIEARERKIAETRWWQFFRRRKLRRQLDEIRSTLFSIGLNQGIKDLVDAGILTEIEPK